MLSWPIPWTSQLVVPAAGLQRKLHGFECYKRDVHIVPCQPLQPSLLLYSCTGMARSSQRLPSTCARGHDHCGNGQPVHLQGEMMNGSLLAWGCGGILGVNMLGSSTVQHMQCSGNKAAVYHHTSSSSSTGEVLYSAPFIVTLRNLQPHDLGRRIHVRPVPPPIHNNTPLQN